MVLKTYRTTTTTNIPAAAVKLQDLFLLLNVLGTSKHMRQVGFHHFFLLFAVEPQLKARLLWLVIVVLIRNSR